MAQLSVVDTIVRIRHRLADSSELVVLISFLLVFLFFSIRAENFLSLVSLTNILTIASIIGIFVVGVAMLMISGEFDLSGGERQSIAIGRAIHFVAKLLILDEPTSALSVAKAQKALTYIESAKEMGLPVIFITHNVNHIYQVSDSYTIIRQGEKVGTYQRGDLSQQDIADLITGAREK